jgi:excisionase family DNA binding protein
MKATTAELTPREAALKLGCRLDAVYALIWAGRLAGRKVDGRWWVPQTDVDNLAQKRNAARARRA